MIDASIYQNQQATPDIVGAIQNGLKMRDMIRQNQLANQQNALRQMMNNAYKVDPATGQTTFAPNAELAQQMVANGGGQQLAEAQALSRQQQHAAQQQGIEDAKLQLGIHDQIWGNVKNASDPEAAFRAAKNLSQKLEHYAPGEVPENYSPEAQKWIDANLGQSQTYAEKLANAFKKQEADAKTTEAAAATSKAASEVASVANKKKELDLEFKKLYGGGSAPGSVNQDTDPASLVLGMVPQHHQAKAFSEIEAAQNTKQNAGKILEAFDSAAQNLHAVDFVPGMQNADQKTLHALLGPTFKDVEGTVRQAAMDNMNNNVTPQFGDTAETVAKKRAALVGYLRSKASAPTAKGAGIDLSKFNSTSADLGLMAGSDGAEGPAQNSAKTIKIPSLQDLDAEIARRQPVAKGRK